MSQRVFYRLGTAVSHSRVSIPTYCIPYCLAYTNTSLTIWSLGLSVRRYFNSLSQGMCGQSSPLHKRVDLFVRATDTNSLFNDPLVGF
jgi:hypothetical protein